MAFFFCDQCPLYELSGRMKAVGGEGPVPADIMLVGEALGYNEAKSGRPFVGRAGQLLNSILEAAGINRNEIYITNMVKHRPPENRRPMPEEIKICGSYLESEYEAVHPMVTVLLGGTASEPIFKVSSTRANGLWRRTEDRLYVGLTHPAYLLRQGNPVLVEETVTVLKAVKAYVGKP